MRELLFLIPHVDQASGGLLAQERFVRALEGVCPARLVTYATRTDTHDYWYDIRSGLDLDDVIVVINWGWSVPGLLKSLKRFQVVYNAHSYGYEFTIPPDVPIWTVSRAGMGYWGRKAPNNLVFHVPNVLADEFTDRNLRRDIDVLVQSRKSSTYLMEDLVPALEDRCRVHVQRQYVEDLSALFNRAKVFLYDSSEHWSRVGVTEGFGLPPLEARACGCHVVSNVRDALSDHLQPGINCQKIRTYSKEFDVETIMTLVDAPPPAYSESDFAPYRLPAVRNAFRETMPLLNRFFDFVQSREPEIPPVGQVFLPRYLVRRLRWWRQSVGSGVLER